MITECISQLEISALFRLSRKAQDIFLRTTNKRGKTRQLRRDGKLFSVLSHLSFFSLSFSLSLSHRYAKTFYLRGIGSKNFHIKIYL